MIKDNAANPITAAVKITVAWLSSQHDTGTPDDASALLRSIYRTMVELMSGEKSARFSSDAAAASAGPAPAVSRRRSLSSKDHIISMIDGKPYKSLRRHLSAHGLTPEEYRQRYNLRDDYPMVAENYSAARREMALKGGLGTKSRRAKAAVGKPPLAGGEHPAERH